jgi:AcrR family transcriptional regulator
MNKLFTNLPAFILEAEQKGWITRTFRRLDPDRQQAVLLAILEETGQNGPQALNIKQVALRSDVAVGSLYQYFGNRDNLLKFALALVVQETVAAFEEYTGYLANLPLREALTAYLGGGIEWTQAQLGIARTFANAAYRGDPEYEETLVKPIAEVMTNMVRTIVQAAQTRGEIRSDLNLEALTRLVNTQLIAIGDAQLFPHLNTYYQLFTPEVNQNDLIDTFITLLTTTSHPDQ